MRRITLLVVSVLLAVAPAASGKVGVQFDKDPGLLKPHEETGFMAMLMNEPRDGERGDPVPLDGVRPLVTFRNADTGEVVRVRTGRTGHEGIAFGRVSFPSRGDWTVRLSAPGLKPMLDEFLQSFEVESRSYGRVVETVPPPSTAPERQGGGVPWLPVVVVVLLAGACAVLRCPPRRLRRALPTRLGGAG